MGTNHQPPTDNHQPTNHHPPPTTTHQWVGGLGWVGLGWVGLGWVGLGWVGLGWVGVGFGLGWVWVSLLLDKCPLEFNKKNVHEMSPKKCPRKVTQKGDISWTILSTRCHQKCPRNVTPFVHEMSPIMSTKCLPPYGDPRTISAGTTLLVHTVVFLKDQAIACC